MPFRKISIFLLSSFIFLLLLPFIVYLIYPNINNGEPIIFIVTWLSFSISGLTFYYAIRTYYSIDSVNTLTRMDGNVLENRYYSIPFTSLVRTYRHFDSTRLQNQLFEELTMRFKKRSPRAIEFATNLQYFIDVIVVFPYLFQANETSHRQMEKLIQLVRKKELEFRSLSSGNLLLIEETVNLLDYIVTYQVARSKQQSIESTILDIRGNMFQNPVTQTVYQNYIGLYYLRTAMKLIQNSLPQKEMDLQSVEGLQYFVTNDQKTTSSTDEKIVLYLKQATTHFTAAFEVAQNDLLWESFIRYNRGRALFFLSHYDLNNDSWQEEMTQAIHARQRLVQLTQEVLSHSRAHLADCFYDEYRLSTLTYFNFCLAKRLSILDWQGNVKYEAPYYPSLTRDEVMMPTKTATIPRITILRGQLNHVFTKK